MLFTFKDHLTCFSFYNRYHFRGECGVTLPLAVAKHPTEPEEET